VDRGDTPATGLDDFVEDLIDLGVRDLAPGAKQGDDTERFGAAAREPSLFA